MPKLRVLPREDLFGGGACFTLTKESTEIDFLRLEDWANECGVEERIGSCDVVIAAAAAVVVIEEEEKVFQSDAGEASAVIKVS